MLLSGVTIFLSSLNVNLFIENQSVVRLAFSVIYANVSSGTDDSLVYLLLLRVGKRENKMV